MLTIPKAEKKSTPESLAMSDNDSTSRGRHKRTKSYDCR